MDRSIEEMKARRKGGCSTGAQSAMSDRGTGAELAMAMAVAREVVIVKAVSDEDCRRCRSSSRHVATQ